MAAPTIANGEFQFALKEKLDRNSKMYLFGAIQFFNCVIFVRPSGLATPSDGFPRWYAKVKPYTGHVESRDSDEDVWG